MADFSFDIVSDYDKAEMNNVHQQVNREIGNRYDFKGTPAAIEWLEDKKGFKVIGANAWQIEMIVVIIGKQLAGRGMTSKVLDLDGDITEVNMRAWKDVPFKQGMSQDDAKKITKLIKSELPKVKTSIQGELIRASSKSKNELQAVQQTLQAGDFDFPISFTNYR